MKDFSDPGDGTILGLS